MTSNPKKPRRDPGPLSDEAFLARIRMLETRARLLEVALIDLLDRFNEAGGRTE